MRIQINIRDIHNNEIAQFESIVVPRVGEHVNHLDRNTYEWTKSEVVAVSYTITQYDTDYQRIVVVVE